MSLQELFYQETESEHLKEEIFIKCTEHLLKQKKRSTKVESLLGEDHRVCSMYGDNGLRDPIGILIPQERYSEAFEVLDPVHVLRVLGVNGDAARILIELQNIHDHMDPSAWQAALTEVALAYSIPWEP